jgi:hypothetical protein
LPTGKSKLAQNRFFESEGMLSSNGSNEIDVGEDDKEEATEIGEVALTDAPSSMMLNPRKWVVSW